MEVYILDLGNRQTKIKTKSVEEVLPSYFIEAANFGDRGVMSFAKNVRDTNDYQSSIDSITYVWGPDLDLEYIGAVNDTLAFGLERYESNDFKLLVDFALARLAKDNEDAKKGILDVQVVTGVPTRDHTNETILNAITGAIKGDHTVVVDGQKLNIRVHDVFILPQSLGTVINEVTNDQGEIIDSAILNTSVAVVDIGGGTVLVDVLNKMNVDTNKKKQSSNGSYKLYEDITGRIYASHGHNVSEYELERIVRAASKESYSLSLDGIGSIDISSEVMDARKDYTRNINKEVKAALKSTERISQVLFTGGTSNLLIKNDSLAVFSNGKFVENSEFANARGFYKFAQAEGLI